MSDNKQITDPKALKDIEDLWAEWVDYEKQATNSIHFLISQAKSPIQNACSYSKDEITKYLKDSIMLKKNSFESSEKQFTILLNKTLLVLKKHCLVD